MLPLIPTDTMTSAYQMVFYVVTVVFTLVGALMASRMS